jgi:3,4-dihydroxyphenylacetate 2,3-dioxygenase
VVTYEDDDAIYLRAFEEYLHHSLVIRRGPVAALAVLAYRVRSEAEVDVAASYYAALGSHIEERSPGQTRGIGRAIRVEDPLGFPIEYFYGAEHVERLTQRYDLQGAAAIARLDHFNLMTPDVPAAVDYYEGLGFTVSEDIENDEATIFAAWMHRKATVHDVALTGGDGPRLHHIAFATHERSQILHLCDHLGALRESDKIERGPGRHGVSNAFYLYLLDPDGHRIEIYTHDYYTGDPDNPKVTWDVHDNQRRDWWGTPVVPSWYANASAVLDLDGQLRAIEKQADASEAEVTIGADGFSYTRKDEGFKIGGQV